MATKNELSTTEAAKIAGVTVATIINHINKGTLPARRRLNAFRINQKAFKKWLEDQGIN